jgi:hypothetical protein
MTATINRRNTPPPHGDRRRYTYWKCRCTPCREAARIYEKRHREKRAVAEYVNPTGTVRRIQGLVAMGYTYPVIGEALGAKDSWVAQLAHRDWSKGIYRRTAESVRFASHKLLAKTPPTGRGAAYARTVARRHGWVPLAAWDNIDDPACQPDLGETDAAGPHADEIAIELVMAGKAPFSVLHTNAERAAAVAAMRAAGRTRTHISRTCGLSHERIRTLEQLAEQAQAGRVAA